MICDRIITNYELKNYELQEEPEMVPFFCGKVLRIN